MGLRHRFDISDRVEIGGVEITRGNCIKVKRVCDRKFDYFVIFPVHPVTANVLEVGQRCFTVLEINFFCG